MYSIRENKEAKDIKPEADTRCGICNESNQQVFLKKGKPLTKTPCCNNWICDDEHTYVFMSYARNSCYRNHIRYTMCGNHYSDGHTRHSTWQDCKIYFVFYLLSILRIHK